MMRGSSGMEGGGMSGTRLRAILSVSLLAMLVGMIAPGAAAGEAPAAPAAQTAEGAPVRAVIEKGRDEMLAALRNSELTKAERGKRVADVCATRIDFETLGKLSLGPAWKEITEAQQKAFLAEFRKHALSVCSGSDRKS